MDRIQHVLEHVCREVQKQAQLYQESVRDQVGARFGACARVRCAWWRCPLMPL